MSQSEKRTLGLMLHPGVFGMNDEKKSLLETLFSEGDNTIKLITLALVVVSGGGNLFVTNQSSSESRSESREEFNRAMKEIHEVHGAIAEALERQKRIEEALKKPTP